METTARQPSFDARGRALPLPVDEERRRALEVIQGLDSLLDMGDEEEQRSTFADLSRAVDQLSDARTRDPIAT